MRKAQRRNTSNYPPKNTNTAQAMYKVPAIVQPEPKVFNIALDQFKVPNIAQIASKNKDIFQAKSKASTMFPPP